MIITHKVRKGIHYTLTLYTLHVRVLVHVRV